MARDEDKFKRERSQEVPQKIPYTSNAFRVECMPSRLGDRSLNLKCKSREAKKINRREDENVIVAKLNRKGELVIYSYPKLLKKSGG